MPDPAATASVVITRPAQQAGPLAARIAALGLKVALLPLLEIHALDEAEECAQLKSVLARLADYDLVAFVSPNAIDCAFAHLPAWPQGVALAVVGEGSRLALGAHGVNDSNASITSPGEHARSDSEHLLLALDLPALTPALRATLEQLLQHNHDWIITSSEALRGLLSLLTEMDREKNEEMAFVVKMKQQHLIVPHARIAQSAAELGFARVTLTGSGDAGVLAALQSRP